VTPDLDWDAQGPLWWALISRQDELAQACVASEGSLVSRDTPHTGEFSWFPSAFHLQEAYCLPMRQGDLSGLLVVCSTMAKAFEPSIQGWLEALGRQIESVMARGMEMEQLRLHSAVIGSVHDAVCVTDLQGRLEWVNQAFSKVLGKTPCQVLGSPLRSFPHAQLQEAWPMLACTTPEVCCVKTEVMEKGSNGESLVLEQVLTPLVDAQGKTTHFIVILHDVTARAVSEMQMKHQAYHDVLTDLPNRIMFEDRLQQALAQARRDGTLLALLFLDLDNFKSINDQYGHQMGDRLLRVVAKRLVTCVRTTDTVSRLSGDEFTIILQGLDRIQDIRQVAQKIVDCLTPPISLGGQDIPVQTSIGIAVSPKDSTDPQRLLAIADRAMYQAKNFGGQRWYFATPEWNIE
jgi:diguanylate cyclase (GGDEF)-like protein/PAS domain S-box-containing protein